MKGGEKFPPFLLPTMRALRIVIILAILVGFPALSWVYLNSGLKWRIGAQDETAVKGMLPEFALMNGDSVLLSYGELLGRYFVIATPQDSQSLRHLEMINTQFHVRPDFTTLFLLPEGENAVATSDSAWTHTSCVRGCERLREALFGSGFTAAIVDDSLRVRGRYHLSSVEEMRKLVANLAVVLPIEKRERIELKRGTNKD